MAKKNWLQKTTCALVTIGAINWGLVSLKFNLVNWLANAISLPGLERLIYALVGLSAVYQVYNYFKK
jgi:uncharacterized membrane protein YuzA (DUF378 family)